MSGGHFMDIYLLIELAAAVIIVIAWAGYVYAKKRSNALFEFARRKGLSFSKNYEINEGLKSTDFRLLREETSGKIANLISGETDGAVVTIFDYTYRAGAGQASTTYSQTVCILKSEKMNLPVFQLYPGNMFYRISAVLGAQDINFQSQAEFSGSYVLRGDDEDSIRNIFTDNVISYFASHKGLSVEGNRQMLLIYRNANMIRTDEIQSFLTEGIKILKLFEQGF